MLGDSVGKETVIKAGEVAGELTDKVHERVDESIDTVDAHIRALLDDYEMVVHFRKRAKEG